MHFSSCYKGSVGIKSILESMHSEPNDFAPTAPKKKKKKVEWGVGGGKFGQDVNYLGELFSVTVHSPRQPVLMVGQKCPYFCKVLSVLGNTLGNTLGLLSNILKSG